MREHRVRISFDIPAEEHTLLKVGCARAQVSIKDFMHQMLLRGIQELEDEELKERLKLSVRQSKEGKVKSRGSFSRFVGS